MAATIAPSCCGTYLYGITMADAAAADDGALPAAQGVAGASVETVVEGRLAAVVSRLESDAVRPQRANLAAHHRILRDLAETRPVAPVVFGTIARDEERLRRLLQTNQDALLDLLARLRGKVEMSLKASWDLPNVFEYFVATHQELEAMRDRLFRCGRTPSVEEKVELGELFVSLLQQARSRHVGRVKESLAPCCADLRTIDPGDERLIMKLACLVQRERQAEWEDGVRRAASLFDDHYCFDYNGPWPPYNFVDIDLKLAGG